MLLMLGSQSAHVHRCHIRIVLVGHSYFGTSLAATSVVAGPSRTLAQSSPCAGHLCSPLEHSLRPLLGPRHFAHQWRTLCSVAARVQDYPTHRPGNQSSLAAISSLYVKVVSRTGSKKKVRSISCMLYVGELLVA